MMRYLLILILFGIGVSQYCFPRNDDNNGQAYKILDKNRTHNYIRYEFGIVRMVIEEGDTLCNVYLEDDTGRHSLTTCLKGPLLQWIFEDLPSELKTTKYLEINEYTPVYHRLSLVNSNKSTEIESSYRKIVGNDEFTAKIDNLKSFIVKLWINTVIMKENKRCPRCIQNAL